MEVVMIRLRPLWLMVSLIFFLALWYLVNNAVARELEFETLTAETHATNSGITAQQQPETCPVTKPQEPTFLPPLPYQQRSGEGAFWYGSDMLWVSLRHNGTWSQLPYRQGGYVQKILWWSEGFDPHAEPNPELTTTVRRVDRPEPVLVQTGASHGWHPELVSFIVGGAHIPSSGCWEITGHYNDTTLSFVVWVAP